MQPTVYLNNKFIPAAEARISPFDAGFLFGAGVFETMLARTGRLFHFERHYARLRNACAELHIVLPFSSGALRNVTLDLLRRNMLNATEARVKILVTPGDTAVHLSHRDSTVLVSAEPYIRPSPRIPWKLLLTGAVHASPSAAYKSISYLPYRLALHEARAKGYDDAIFLDRNGMLSETSIASLLLFRGDTLLLPQSDDALRGITRGVIAEAASARGMVVVERSVGAEEILDGYAVCVCNALLGPFPVGRINETEIPLPDDNLLTALREDWEKSAA
jgi:branched-chain amino acid aminotransferase